MRERSGRGEGATLVPWKWCRTVVDVFLEQIMNGRVLVCVERLWQRSGLLQIFCPLP